MRSLAQPSRFFPGSFPGLTSKALSEKDKAICHPLVLGEGTHQSAATSPPCKATASLSEWSEHCFPGIQFQKEAGGAATGHTVSQMSPWESLAGRWDIICEEQTGRMDESGQAGRGVASVTPLRTQQTGAGNEAEEP
ncbi:hypothetical protein HispidOSU_027727 [Sigmodon hispidus]